MYVREHLPPHFHAVYGEFEANVSIESGDVLEGRLTKVVELKAVAPHRLRVRFNTGQEGWHDCSLLVRDPGPMIEPLKDPAFFARVFLEFGAPTWPNGFDISPEWLRREMQTAGELSGSAA